MNGYITPDPRHSMAALCEPCGWQGPGRRDSLVALADFDRHQVSRRHADTMAKAARKRPEPELDPEPCDECDGTRWPREAHEAHCSLHEIGEPIEA